MSSDDESTPSAENAGRGPEGAREERRALQRRMEQIRQDVHADVEANWTAMWRSEELVGAKVEARLSGHEEYQKLVRRVREVEMREADAKVEGQGDASGGDTT